MSFAEFCSIVGHRGAPPAARVVLRRLSAEPPRGRLQDHALFTTVEGAAFETAALRGPGIAELRLQLEWFSAG